MAYDKPKIDLVNKKYETLSKGLNKIYSDVAKNADLIKKRNKARLKIQTDGIAKMQKRFEDATGANIIAAANLKDQIGGDDESKAQQARDLFVNQVNDLYEGGLNDIELFMKGKIDENGNPIKNGKPPTRGATSAFVNKLIGNAINVTDGLIGLDNFSDEYNQGLKNLAGSNGKNKGSLVLGSQYDGIFNVVNGETAMTGENLSYENLMLHGRLSSKNGVKVFLDKDESGGIFTQEDAIIDGQTIKVNTNEFNTGEILDLSQVGKDYKKADNKYFTKVKGWDEYLKAPSAAIKNSNKALDFLVDYEYLDANGTKHVGKRIDRKKRQEYFTKGEGKKVIDNVIQTTTAEDINGMIQAIGGMKLYQKYATGTTEEKAKIMEIVRLGIIENMSPLVTKGETSKLVPSTSTVSQTYKGSNFEDDAVYDIVKNNVIDVTNSVFSGHNQSGFPPETELNRAFKGHYFKMATPGQKGKIGYGKIDSFTEDPSNPGNFELKILVKPPTRQSGAEYEIIPFNLNANPAGGNAKINNRAALERGLAFGYFPDEDSAHLQDMVKQANEGNPKFLSGSGETRTTTKKQVADMTIEEFNAYVNGDTVPKVDDVVNEFLDQNPVVSNTVGGGANTSGTSGNVTGGTGGGSTNVVGPPNFNTTNFVIDPNGGIAPAQGASPDATSSVILSIMNDEDTIGASGGGGVGNFGFTGGNSAKGQWLLDNAFTPTLKQLKSDYPGLDQKQYEAMAAEEAIEKYIIGKGSPTMGEKNTTIMSDLGVSYDQFDKFPADLKRTLIDYKLNSGRSSKDLIAVALGKETGEDAYLDTKVSEVDNFVKDITYNAATLAKLTPQKLEEARNDMYLAPIKVISESLISNPKGDAKIGNVTLSYADRVKAADSKWTAWVTSQGLRGGGTGDQGNYGVIAKLTAKPSTSCKAVNFKSVMDNNNLPTDQEFKDAYNNAKKGDLLITPDGEVKRKL